MRACGKTTLVALVTLLFLGCTADAMAQQIAGVSPAATRPAPAIPMFGEREIHYVDLAPFARWSNLLARWEHEKEDAAESCVSARDTAPPCPPHEWAEVIERFRGLPLRNQIDGINAAVNAHPYVSALTNWGDPAHWETPFEFFRHNGQCQDYAVTKFLLLRELGVPDSAMRVVVLRDMRREVDHAVLAVAVSGRALMLDNLARNVVSADADPDYHAYYSINGSGWWLHVPNPLMPQAPQLASR